ncbi:MAG: iron export ABC transporter permease subunit FetB [Coriobacteriia bacterium]|nr:iron export ABC transporter permease subunit FetB [Coriobacteriia bacterium]MBN2822334.1 iron export ABC transporter permease subunit FetB [Coriobacteriia bacterium]
MSADGAIVIGWWELALAMLFVLVTGGLSIAMSLKLEKDLAIATVRTYVQLMALGFVLRWVFANQTWYIVIALMLVMITAAARVVLKRAPDAPPGLFGNAALSMALTGFTVTFAVTALVVRVPTWYEARYVLPIAGMVVGNSMTGIALAVERVFSDMESRRDEMLAMTALGATAWEAARPSVRTALTAGMMPTINSMAAAGVVFIPGMMTGQILAGADPLEATKYQIVVMLMISAATAIGAISAVMLMYRKRFTDEGVYLEKGLRIQGRKPK